jgi:hypothetical protein
MNWKAFFALYVGSAWKAADYIVSMKLRSLSLRLGCFSLRSALASI